MISMILVDTTFLIDLRRGRNKAFRRDAEEWLRRNAGASLGIPAVVFGEFAEGFDQGNHQILLDYVGGYRVFPVDSQVSLTYGAISRRLRLAGMSIGANDTWIAATALGSGLPLLTRNRSHFERVPGLVALDYGDDISKRIDN